MLLEKTWQLILEFVCCDEMYSLIVKMKQTKVVDWRFIDTAVDNFSQVKIESKYYYSFQLQSVHVVAIDGNS